MVPAMSLLIPILLSAVLVFLVSFVIHMVLPIHKGDMRKLAKEAEVMEALRRFSIPPGDYAFPCPSSMAEMKTPEFIEKRNQGPVALMTVLPNGPYRMGKSLMLWFLYAVLVGYFAAYIAGRALPPGAEYLSVFRFTGAAAFAGYSLALLQDSIWHGRRWGTTLKSVGDGLVYGVVTAGTFGWLWPGA
jgi:hypothetical protein